jgi:hypothetical protein
MALFRRCVPAVLLAVAWSIAAPVAARAQVGVADTATLDFSRPESWGMKYYASLALPTGMGAPHTLGAGRLELGLEAGDVPRLNEAERRIGFDGTKLEDVNKTSFFGRLRGSVGLGGAVALELAYTPPIERGGTKANILALAVARPFKLSDSWRLGVRGYAQVGTIEADVTCSAREVAAGDDASANPFQCVEPSHDRSLQKLIGFELVAGCAAGSRFNPYIGLGVNHMDLEFHIDALYAGGLVEDRSVLLTSGATLSATAGLTFAAGVRWRVTAEAFYSWLNVARPPSSHSGNEGLLNGRVFVSYRVN